MDYFVIKTSGSQYLVKPGDVLELPNLNIKDGEAITFKEVLLSKVGDKLEIGTPLVAGATVKATVLKNFQGEKVHVMKFKAKSRYRRTTGFRAQLTTVKIAGGEEKAKEGVKKAAASVVKTVKKAKTLKP